MQRPVHHNPNSIVKEMSPFVFRHLFFEELLEALQQVRVSDIVVWVYADTIWSHRNSRLQFKYIIITITIDYTDIINKLNYIVTEIVKLYWNSAEVYLIENPWS